MNFRGNFHAKAAESNIPSLEFPRGVGSPYRKCAFTFSVGLFCPRVWPEMAVLPYWILKFCMTDSLSFQ